jgi:hypothetical protein
MLALTCRTNKVKPIDAVCSLCCFYAFCRCLFCLMNFLSHVMKAHPELDVIMFRVLFIELAETVDSHYLLVMNE